MAAILNAAILDSAICIKNFTHVFSLKLMMAANLISVILNLAILDSTILVCPLKLTHTCQDWFPPFAQKILHSFILTQLDDSSHLKICQLEFDHLSFPCETHSHLPRLVPNIFTKKLHSFILTQLDDCSLKSAILNSAILYKKYFTHSFWLNFIMAAILKSAMLVQTLPSWIQTPCYLLSDSLKNTLLPLWLWLKLIQCD